MTDQKKIGQLRAECGMREGQKNTVETRLKDFRDRRKAFQNRPPEGVSLLLHALTKTSQKPYSGAFHCLRRFAVHVDYAREILYNISIQKEGRTMSYYSEMLEVELKRNREGSVCISAQSGQDRQLQPLSCAPQGQDIRIQEGDFQRKAPFALCGRH